MCHVVILISVLQTLAVHASVPRRVCRPMADAEQTLSNMSRRHRSGHQFGAGVSKRLGVRWAVNGLHRAPLFQWTAASRVTRRAGGRIQDASFIRCGRMLYQNKVFHQIRFLLLPLKPAVVLSIDRLL